MGRSVRYITCILSTIERVPETEIRKYPIIIIPGKT